MKTAIPEIKIDLDKPCTSCGQMGAMENGICLTCATDKMNNDPEQLATRAIVSASRQIDKLLAIHASEIHKAYLKSDISIGLTVELTPSDEISDAIKVKAKINFVESRVKDENIARVSRQEKFNL